MRSRHLLIVCASVAASLSINAARAGDHCRRQDPERGLAILSPLECPDPCDSPVGGRYKCTPYYPGYLSDRRCCYPVSIYSGYASYGSGSYGTYGHYSGARRDEANLLRLGGMGQAPVPQAMPQK